MTNGGFNLPADSMLFDLFAKTIERKLCLVFFTNLSFKISVIRRKLRWKICVVPKKTLDMLFRGTDRKKIVAKTICV